MKIFLLAYHSLLNRRFVVFLTMACIAVSVVLLLGLVKVKEASEEGFTQTVSQVDLLVGARGGPLQLLLYSVFNMGQATNNVSWKSYQKWKNHPSVQWTIPYSLGDSYRGFRVVATDQNFFEHYRFRGHQKVEFFKGREFEKPQEVVLGWQAYEDLKTQVGESAVITHGVTKGAGVIQHDDRPFQIVGVLKRTNTALDQSVYISLESMELIHLAEPTDKIEIRNITSFFLRTQNRIETLQLQRNINEDPSEPLMAIIPGVALSELWRNLSYFEKTLQGVIYLVAGFSLIILMLMMVSTLESRRREMALLRSLGAGPELVLFLLALEAVVISSVGVVLGLLFTQSLVFVFQDFLLDVVGVSLKTQLPSWRELLFLIWIVVGSFLISLVPGLKARSQALKDGLMIKS